MHTLLTIISCADIGDRGPDNFAYCKHYVDEQFYREIVQSSDAQECISRYKNSIIILIEPQQRFIEDDGIRMVSKLEEAQAFTETFKFVFQDLRIRQGFQYAHTT